MVPRPLNPNNYHGWRKLVFKRDGYRCVLCGSCERIEADHIIPFSKAHDIQFDINNGRTLCHSCHKQTGTYGGRVRTYGKPNC